MAYHSVAQELRDLAHSEGTGRSNDQSIRLLTEILAAHPELELNPELKLKLPETGNYFIDNAASSLGSCDESSVLSAIKPLESELSNRIRLQNLPEDMIGIFHSKTPVVKPLGKAIWDSDEGVLGDFVQISAPKDKGKSFASDSARDEPFSTGAVDQQYTIEYKVDAPTAALIDKWQGTSVLKQPEWLIAGSKDILEQLIVQRSAAENEIQKSPYDPENWMLLTQVYYALCYPDLQVSTAYRALLLINQGLNFGDRSLGHNVRSAIARRLSCDSGILVACELDYQRLEAYKALISGLRDIGAYFDGLTEAKKALRFYPDDDLLLEFHKYLKEAFNSKLDLLQNSGLSPDQIKLLSRSGRTHKRRYPWLKDELFHRTPALVADINSKLNSSNCEIRQVHFGGKPMQLRKQTDVGPLGVFAKRDIKKGEVVLIDDSISVISSIHPLMMTHCDACQASLSPVVHTSGIRVANCCKGVSFCSDRCHDTAINGYHKVSCGRDFRWVYKNTNSDGQDPCWRALILLRLFAIIIADQRANAKKKVHPLKHNLLVRLTEGYSSNASTDDSEYEWSYTSNVVAPTKILLQFGVDIFSCLEWSPEVLHTIFWREVNNACRVTSITIQDGQIHPNPLSGIGPNYIFFNHSCDANVNWMAAGGGQGVTLLGQMGLHTNVGCSSLLCVAARAIKAGEECRISYVPPQDRKQLHRWFEGGCGCALCEKDGDAGSDKT